MLALRRQLIRTANKLAGRKALQRLVELNQNQWLSPDELDALQKRRLQALVTYAYQYVPYYRRLFDNVGFHPTDLARDPTTFHQIPPVSKACMRSQPEEFFSTEPGKKERLCKSSTSGSTGRPFVFWEDRTFQDYAVANTFRHHTWSGWEVGRPRVYLWPLIEYDLKQRFKEKVRNFAWNTFFMNTDDMSEEKMSKLAHLIKRHKPYLLQGYPTPLCFFAEFVQATGWAADLQIPAVYSTSEILYPQQRRLLQETFGAELFNRYATQELSGLACECSEHAGLHLSTETNYLELLDENDRPVECGRSGTVVATNLTNYGFPFIRYRLEDVARVSPDRCQCGRGQPILEVIEGRLADMFRTRDGRGVMGNFQIETMFEMDEIKQFKMIQKSLELIVVQLAITDQFKDSHLDFIERTIKEVMGPETEVRFEFFDSLPAEKGRKYRYAVSELNS